MTTKEYLQQIHKQDVKIGQRITQLKKMEARLAQMEDYAYTTGSFDYSKDRVQSSPTGGNARIEEKVDYEKQIEELMETIGRMIHDAELLKNKIITEIQSLDNATYVDILYRRYFDCDSFERIACDMNYTYQYILNLHGEALKAFEKDVRKCEDFY